MINYLFIFIIIISIINGIFGALTGAGVGRYFRRYLIAIILTSIALIIQYNPLLFFLLGIIICLSMGYGIPCESDPKPSMLGKFWYEYFSIYHMKQELLANIFTRGTIGLLIALFCICIPLIKHNWITYITCSIGIILTFSLLSWRDLRVYELFGLQLLWSETVTYGIMSLMILIMIYY